MIRHAEMLQGIAYAEFDIDGLATAFDPDFPIHEPNRSLSVCRVRDVGMSGWFGAGITKQSQIDALMRDGWPEGAQRLQELAASIGELPMATCVKRRLRWDPDSGELDLDRFMSAGDMPYRTTRRDKSTGPAFVRIIASWGGGAIKRADELFWAGAAMLALSNALEQAGYSTELVLQSHAISGYGGGFDHCVRVTVKQAGEQVSLNRLAFLSAHAGALRTYGFQGYKVAPTKLNEGLGHQIQAAPLRSKLESIGLLAPSDVLVDSCFSLEDARRELGEAVAFLNAYDAKATA